MSEHKVIIGMDRFISKRWADYAFELRSSPTQEQDRYSQLQEWLNHEIKGKEVAEKTASQLRHLWLAEDRYNVLRDHAVACSVGQDSPLRTILHYGMAINVFPFFRDLCAVVGRLIQLQGYCQGHEVQQRLLEKYPSKATIVPAARRGLLTLVEWGLLVEDDEHFTTRPVLLKNNEYSVWFILSLLNNLPGRSASLADLQSFPDNLGIQISDLRSAIRETDFLLFERNGREEEVVICR